MNRKCVRILQQALAREGIYQLSRSPEKCEEEDAVYDLLREGMLRETTLSGHTDMLQFSLTTKGWAAADWRRAG